MVDQRVAVDDAYDIFLFPLQMLWFFVPSGIRKRITTIPWATFVWVGKVIWTFMFYYWIYIMVAPILIIPDYLLEYWVSMMDALHCWRESFWVWYSTITISPFSILFPGISFTTWIMTKLGKRPQKTFIQGSLDNLKTLFYVPERAIQGSELIPAKELPSFCCFILGVSENDEERLVGCGFRVENAIMTAAHNLTGFEQLKIMSNTAVCIIDVDKAVVHPYDDFAYFNLSDRDFSMLGMSKGKLLDHAVPKSYPMICQVYGPGTPVSFTMGAVTPVENFGKVTYGGSTTHGFSGSPYIQNKTIVGMHLGAGMVNLGLDAAYMHMLVSIRQESTEDWLMDMIEQDQLNKRAVKWERSPVDPDEVYVVRQGKYFTMDADTFFSVYNPQSFVTESFAIQDKLPTFTYSDSKNDAMAPAHESVSAGANGQTSGIRNCVQTPLTASSYQTPSSIKTLEENLATEAQEQTLAPQSNPSGCILNNIKYQPERNKRRHQQKWKKSTKLSSQSTNPGSPGLELIR